MDINQTAIEMARASGFEAGTQTAIYSIFKDLDQILMNTYSDTYGSWKGIDREIADLKKKYGVR